MIDRLRPELAKVPGIELYLQPVQDLSIEDRVSRTQFQFSPETPDSELLQEWTPRPVEALRERPELTDVASDLQSNGLQIYTDIDRDAAARPGIRVADITDALYDAFGQRQISTIFTQASQYRVVLEAEAGNRPAGAGTVVRAKRRWHAGTAVQPGDAGAAQRPAADQPYRPVPGGDALVQPASGVSLGKAVQVIEAVEQEIGLPAGIQTRFRGAAEAFRASLSSTLLLILAAVVTMYIVLGVLYESYIHPITILSTLPSAAVGALLALLLTGNDRADRDHRHHPVDRHRQEERDHDDRLRPEAERQQGMSPQDAIYRAALLRFRPILMTTLAALFGAIPLMLASGSGAELRQPLGPVLVGGLLLSQLLTLFTTPVIYLFFDRLGQRFGRRREPLAEAQA